MAQLSSDSFATGQALLSVDEAVHLLFARVTRIAERETVALMEADGRILAVPLVAPLDLPGFDNSAVDGYAVRFADLAPHGDTILPVVGRAAAGHAPEGADVATKAALRIFTGAPLPSGFDTVFMQEDCRQTNDGRVVLPAGLSHGANARPKGEDVAWGAKALPAGLRLTPESVALAAALGVASLSVTRRLRVAIFSTGDEIMTPGTPLRPAAVYDANRFLLMTLLKRLGIAVTDLGVLPDEDASIRRALAQAAAGHDLVLTSGGVSIGEEDHVKTALAAIGTLVFWRIAIKPGRPVALGVIAGTPFVGLPGNPVAVFVTFTAIVRPLLAALAGETWMAPQPMPVTAAFEYHKKKGRREYVRVTLRQTDAGLEAQKYPIEGTGILTSLTRTDGLVQLDEEVEQVAPGDRVGFLAYPMLR